MGDAFMHPAYHDASTDGTFTRYTVPNGDTWNVPSDTPLPEDTTGTEIIDAGIFVRLSAPGYLDATDWDGPFEDISAAQQHISDTHSICAECGADMDEENTGLVSEYLCTDCDIDPTDADGGTIAGPVRTSNDDDITF